MESNKGTNTKQKKTNKTEMNFSVEDFRLFFCLCFFIFSDFDSSSIISAFNFNTFHVHLLLRFQIFALVLFYLKPLNQSTNIVTKSYNRLDNKTKWTVLSYVHYFEINPFLFFLAKIYSMNEPMAVVFQYKCINILLMVAI